LPITSEVIVFEQIAPQRCIQAELVKINTTIQDEKKPGKIKNENQPVN